MEWLGIIGIMPSRHRLSKPTVTRKIKLCPLSVNMKNKILWEFNSLKNTQFPPTFSLLKAEDDQDIYSLKLSECKTYCCLLSAVHASYTEIYKILSMAQRTRRLISGYQSNFFRSYHKFSNKSWSEFIFYLDQAATSKPQPNISISTKLKLQNLNQT